jgi:hypothetical protein
MALDLFDLSVSIMRQNLRRAHPTESPSQIERRLASWLETRPGAELGDSAGHVADRFGIAPK